MFTMIVLLYCAVLFTVDIHGVWTASDELGSRSAIQERYRHRRDVSEAPTITDLYITSRVKSRFAVVSIASRVLNVNYESSEATFNVQIPESAFISKFTMTINGVLKTSTVYEKKHAQQKYRQAKQSGQSAGQVKHQGKTARGMEVFNVNVNVAAMGDVHFELTYQQLLERRLGLYEQRIMVEPLQVVDNLTIELNFHEPQQFDRFSYSEPNNVEVYRTSSPYTTMISAPTSRRLLYRPSLYAQKAVDRHRGIGGEYVVTYDVGHKFDGGTIVYATENDYFVHYFAVDGSNDISPLPKNILFVIDISGSMKGRKIWQTREAMTTILTQLRPGDYFNILLFHDNMQVWQRNAIAVSQGNIKAATDFVQRYVHPRGGTNINGALVESVVMVANDPAQRDRTGIIVFLTDGKPTNGETDIELIRANVFTMNEGRVSIFALGFGDNVNFELLQMISWENGGFAKRIYEDSDADDQLKNFFREVNNPLLRDVRFEYRPDQVIISDLTRTRFKQYFDGTEVVVTGRRSATKIDATVRGSTTSNAIELVVPDASKSEISGPSGEFTEKLWAYLTIKDLLRKKAIARSGRDREILQARALKLSLTYNLVTPLTSLLVLETDDEVDEVEVDDHAAINRDYSPFGGTQQSSKKYADMFAHSIPAKEEFPDTLSPTNKRRAGQQLESSSGAAGSGTLSLVTSGIVLALYCVVTGRLTESFVL